MAIIGLSGKAGSGKDLVGEIISGLTVNKDADYEWIKKFHSNSDWKIIKFADKLKDMVCLLIGCTREQLEDREYKESPLGPRWTKYVVEYDDYDSYHSANFATKAEADACATEVSEYYRNIEVKEVQLTPRLLLQLLGTEAGRRIIHPDIWVNATMTNFDAFANRIITDCRFPNEADAIKDRGGINIRVNRLSNKESVDLHESEIALDNYAFDYVVDNNGTIEELIEKITVILEKEKII